MKMIGQLFMTVFFGYLAYQLIFGFALQPNGEKQAVLKHAQESVEGARVAYEKAAAENKGRLEEIQAKQPQPVAVQTDVEGAIKFYYLAQIYDRVSMCRMRDERWGSFFVQYIPRMNEKVKQDSDFATLSEAFRIAEMKFAENYPVNGTNLSDQLSCNALSFSKDLQEMDEIYIKTVQRSRSTTR